MGESKEEYNKGGDGEGSKPPRLSLAETIAHMRKMALTTKIADAILDDYKTAEDSKSVIRLKTGVAYDYTMTMHSCEWDKNYPENPKRYEAIMDRVKELGLLKRINCCEVPENRNIIQSVQSVHTMDPLNLLSEICKGDMNSMKKESAKYDAIYFNKNTAMAASTALSLCYGMVNSVVSGQIQNGLAIVRPPGHHAMPAEFCGYCYVNNVAVTARAILDDEKNYVKKILILDFDVHHGQATQQMFYDTNEVLYISIHRYEHGNFWPNLRQSNFDFIGKPSTPGYGYNVNIPLNTTGCGDAEYMAIFTNIILPMAYEYQPDLVIFSAGYDAAIGCPEGEMCVTPAFYGHMITLLSGLANGKLAVVLEGGYYPPSLAEGVALTLKALLNEPNGLLEPLGQPNASVVDSINNVIGILHPHWKCFNHQIRLPTNLEVFHPMVIRHEMSAALPPFPVENCYPVQSWKELDIFAGIMEVHKGTTLALSPLPVGYTYDDVMLDHCPTKTTHPERPERLRAVFELFKHFGLDKRCYKVKHAPAATEQLFMAHDIGYVSKLMHQPMPDVAELRACANAANSGDFAADPDVYASRGSWNAVLNAAGCVMNLCQAVMDGVVASGIALVRPPGHHAESDHAKGFCLVNNVVLGAKWIKQHFPKERIMIMDFDIHHGNGTQNAFYDDNQVLFISMHKYEFGQFYPGFLQAGTIYNGQGNGAGYNINIPFSNGKLGDSDYMAVFHTVVLPIAYSFAPTVILVSAGFDAGINDTLGNYTVTPQAFGHFIQMLRPLAKGRLILTMEGGYNICTLKYGMVMCAKALLGDPLPPLEITEVCDSAKVAIQEVIAIHRQMWPVLDIVRPLRNIVQSVFLANGDAQLNFKCVSEDALNLNSWNKLMYPREFEKVPTYNDTD